MKKHLPNLLTSANLFAGCIGIVQAFEGNLRYAVYWGALALVLDFLDGMTARLLKAQSELGKQLDSLADLLSFGMLPASILFMLLTNVENNLWAYGAFIYAVFAAWRLAKFNIDTRQTQYFIGLPTPASALTVFSIPLLLAQYPSWTPWLNQGILLGLTALLSVLSVANLPLFSLKFKDLGFKENALRYVFLGLALIFLALFQWAGIPLLILLYIGLSVFFYKPSS